MSMRTTLERQRDLAGRLEVDIAGASISVASARLYDEVAQAIGHKPSQPSTPRQRTFAQSLGIDVSADSSRVASARISDSLLARNAAAIEAMALRPGDRVLRVKEFDYEGEHHKLEEEFVVSSIQPNGRIHFKGGNGQGAWPTEVSKVGVLR